ncbi:SWIM zinc finger family protein [Ruminococcus sp. CLA-AA-H200]|uniref:SWIM zinc finger family protein n=1 Tax=Ruminococcus turbiniformis TaxID=2881258 RepID=A0ABS8G1D6_9FIRM|nr:SWIM zinc finger family protein [Ruminococcus turbiniformis]MCC2256130.1 SWIM zinc finger family protein [Ruminococcus turbiniformis]
MSGWKDLFREHILARGEMYYYDGAVQDLEKTEHGYHALVKGTDDYEVDIEMEDGQICEMYCTCPYAADRNNCKHMAAVLYEIAEQEEEGSLTEGSGVDQAEDELEEIIENIPETELRSFVKQLAGQDDEIRNTLMTRYAVRIDEKQMCRLKEGVDQIVWEYGDRSGFVDYRNAWDFTREMDSYLEDKADTLMERNCWRQAFELTNYVFKTIGNVDIDDSDGGTTQVANTCYDKWKEILENCTEEVRDEMFKWFTSHLACDYVIDYKEEYMEEFLTHEFRNREMLEKKMAYLDEMIERQTDSTDCGNMWSARYGYENNILKRLEIMDQLGYPEKEIREYHRKHWRFSTVREMEIQEDIERGELDEAVRILKESKELDREYPGLVARYSEQLVSIYEAQADKKAYKEELQYYVLECPQHDLAHIQKLKAVCTETEWGRYREQILQSRNSYSIQYSFMESEGMYERMLQCMQKEQLIFNVDKYENALKKKFPEQVRDIYISYVHKQAERTGDRKRYRELMQYLKKIRRYPGGKEKAAEIAENWRALYSRRSAMMDELQKAGF